MAADSTSVYSAFLLIQLVGMVAFYIYYTHKNKRAEKEYWRKLDQQA